MKTSLFDDVYIPFFEANVMFVPKNPAKPTKAPRSPKRRMSSTGTAHAMPVKQSNIFP